MSIGPIEDNPVGDDEVTIVDPGDVTVEPSYGHDTVPWNVSGEVATGHADPDAENITHVPGVSRGREVDGMDFFDLDFRAPDHGRGTDPDAAFGTGTETRPDRYVHDEALQVRQVLPTNWLVYTVVLPDAAISVLVAPERPERIRILLRPSGVNPGFVVVGPDANLRLGAGTSGDPGRGWPLLPTDGVPLELTSLGEVWGSGFGDGGIVYVLEEIRTDVDAS